MYIKMKQQGFLKSKQTKTDYIINLPVKRKENEI